MRQRQAIANVIMALAKDLQIEGEHKRRALGLLGAIDEVFDEFAVLHHIELEPEGLACGLRHILNRADGHCGERERNTGLERCLSQQGFHHRRAACR